MQCNEVLFVGVSVDVGGIFPSNHVNLVFLCVCVYLYIHLFITYIYIYIYIITHHRLHNNIPGTGSGLPSDLTMELIIIVGRSS